MGTRGKKILDLLKVPTYETKTSTKNEQNLAIQGWLNAAESPNEPSLPEISTKGTNTIEGTKKERKLAFTKKSNRITKRKVERNKYQQNYNILSQPTANKINSVDDEEESNSTIQRNFQKNKSTTGTEKNNEDNQQNYNNLPEAIADKVYSSDEEESNEEENNKKKASQKYCKRRNLSEKDLDNSAFNEVQEAQDGVLFHAAKKRKDNGKRVRDKGHACYFCENIIINMAKHLEVKHSKEVEVAKILAMPKSSKQRRDAFGELIKIGDFQHNCNVLALKSGELILVRRPSEVEKIMFQYLDYGPCPDCLGFTLKRHLWHHIKYGCLARKRNDVNHEEKDRANRNIISESKALITGIIAPEFSSDYIGYIISKLREDDIGRICQNDQTIVKFGYLQFEKYGTTQCELLRQRMRQIGRLLIEIQKLNSDIKELSDCLTPQNFDIIVAATKALCVTTITNESRPQFQIPSLALKIGHSLRKCISLQRGQALRTGNLKANRNCVSLQHLMKMEWSSRISSNALSTLQKRKFNTNEILPLTEDLVKLKDFLDKEINSCRQQLSKNCNETVYKKLQTYTLSRIILFNKRRSGEASRITLEQFQSMPSHETLATQELRDSLSPLERTLASRLNVVDVVGKRGRKVPVLVTPDVKLSIEILLQKRDKVNICEENVYIFARTTGLGHLRGYDCLKIACEEANLRYPENITSTKLRKYIATVCQLFDLNENEQDWLARHLGHDIRVHRDFYRLHERTVEAAKVSRLLLAVERGEVNKFAGKPLEEINITDLPALEDDDETITLNNNNNVDTRESDSSDSEKTEKVLKTVSRKKKVRRKDSTIKTPWSKEEKETVLNYFKKEIKSKILPGKKKCEQCISEHTLLQTRKWSDLKFYIKNFYTKNKKMLQ